jgi:hypothetical protein
MPAGPPGRIALRDAVDCAGRWMVVGAVVGAGGRVVMVGARSGGVHGNLRVSTWYQRRAGVLAEAQAAFETYGGERAINVGPVAGGPAGFLIAGNRSAGAAAWVSPDGIAFTLVEGAPGLAGPAGVTTVARDAVAAADGRWILVGRTGRTGSPDPDPAAWHSPDGRRWSVAAMPGEAGANEVQRVTRVGADLVAVGLRGDTFGAWRGDGTSWRPAGRFGVTTGAIANALAVTTIGPRVVAATDTNGAYGLWLSADLGGSRRHVAAGDPAGARTARCGSRAHGRRPR